MLIENEIVRLYDYSVVYVNPITCLGQFFLYFAKIQLLCRIIGKNSCAGISKKTQIAYGIIIASRFVESLSLVFNSLIPISIHVFKFCGVLLSCAILWSIRYKYKNSYIKEYEKYSIFVMALPCIVLSLHDNHKSQQNRRFWSFSYYLESIACLPQYDYMKNWKLRRNGDDIDYVGVYLTTIRIGKLLEVIAEFYNFFYAKSRYESLVLACGIIQLSFDFVFCLCAKIFDDKRNVARSKDKDRDDVVLLIS